MKVLLIIALVAITLAVVLIIIGIATPEWLVLDLDRERTLGLFKECLPVIKCFESEDPPGYIIAVRVMVFLGMLAGALSDILGLVHLVSVLWAKGSYRHLALTVTIISVAGSVSAVIGIIIYGAEYDNVRRIYHLGYSFTLCLVGAILLGAGGALFWFGDKKRSITIT